MTPQDFNTIGIGLADARLMVENYRTESRANELAGLVAAVRSKQKDHTKKKECTKRKRTSITVKYGWHHWCPLKKRYKVVKLASGVDSESMSGKGKSI